ncbi:MAG: SPOR domain-containing protein [Panacagrimonas sp.]
MKRLVGVVALILAALLLTSILPTPGRHGLDGKAERVVTIDLTHADSMPVELTPPGDELESGATAPRPVDAAARGGILTPPAESGLAFQNEEPIATAESPVPTGASPTVAVPPPPESEVENRKPVTPTPPPTMPAIAAPTPPPKKTAPVEIAAPPSATMKSPARPAPTGSGRWQVQAGAFSQLDRAEGVRAKAGAAGVSCLISPAEGTQGGTLYRVRCGPYATRALGEAAVRALGRSGVKAQMIGAGG